MEIRIRGQMTIADIRQALFEQLHELETKYAVKFSRGATLYIRGATGFGADGRATDASANAARRRAHIRR